MDITLDGTPFKLLGDRPLIKVGDEARNAWLMNDKLQLNFVKGSSDNPKINAILLVKGSLKDTDYIEKMKFTEPHYPMMKYNN